MNEEGSSQEIRKHEEESKNDSDELKTYSLKEVSEQNGENGNRVWIIIDGIIYDVTDYMQEHPGGEELLRESAGRDATKDFQNVGHSSDAKKLMKKFVVGVLKNERKLPVENNANEISEKRCCNIL